MTSSACRPPLGAVKSQTHARRFAIGILAAALMLPVARAAQPGTIVGVVTNSAKLPVAGVTVTAVRADGEAIRATVSGSDGVYSFADLPPGAWSLTLDAAGYQEVAVPALEVVASKATRHDVVMNVRPGAP